MANAYLMACWGPIESLLCWLVLTANLTPGIPRDRVPNDGFLDEVDLQADLWIMLTDVGGTSRDYTLVSKHSCLLSACD